MPPSGEAPMRPYAQAKNAVLGGDPDVALERQREPGARPPGR